MRINDKENYDAIRSSITMVNLKKIIRENNLLIAKIATNSKISSSTVSAYMNGQKIPSIPTLISIADFLNCNLDYLLDRTDNPLKVDNIKSVNGNADTNQLINSIISLPKHKQSLLKAYIKGLLDK